MFNTLTNACIFLINTLVDLYLFVLIIRLLLVWTRVHYFNPLTQFVTKLTNPLVKPLRRFLPNYRQFETASALLIFIICFTKFVFLLLLTSGFPNLGGVLLLTIGQMIKLFIDTFFYVILVQCILSLVQPYSPLNYSLSQISTPLLRPFQRILPPIGGFDVSPIPALILLQLLNIILVDPINQIGLQLAAG